MPKGARAGQAERVQARTSACVPNGGRACQTDGAHDQGNARVSNGGRTFPRENLCFLGLIWGFQSKILVLPQGIWGFQRESMHAKLSAHVRSSPRGCAHANRREPVPKGAPACQTEGAHSQGSAPMRNGGRTCPGVRAHAKRRVHVPRGEFGVSRDSLGFPIKILGFQAGARVRKMEGDMPKRARACQPEGANTEHIVRLPNGGHTLPKERTPAKRRLHVPKAARVGAKQRGHKPKRARACQTEGAHSQGRIYVFLE